MKNFNWRKIVALAAIVVVAAGCTQFANQRTRHRANSLYKFLYPAGSERVDTPSIPTLNLPLRVGVAFVPTENGDGFQHEDLQFSEAHKAALLKKVSEQFKSYPFVKNIEIIPTAYLTPGGGFANLDQLRTMYSLDVMALLSYDQAQFTDEGLLSLTYWTIVGAYVIPGEKNDTRTMLDAAVYDIASRKLLFRAPGISAIQNSSTFVNQSRELRNSSEEGFEQAATNLVAELKVQLGQFQERVKNSPAEYKVAHRPGYTGQGAFNVFDVGLMACAGVGLILARREWRK
ncbi:MAG TPA: rhombotarget lipoprotein [Verrucomicrobiae bacterium]|nr:rhombotarget lipoprotein [Verrucomicrobiae bacterium]